MPNDRLGSRPSGPFPQKLQVLTSSCLLSFFLGLLGAPFHSRTRDKWVFRRPEFLPILGCWSDPVISTRHHEDWTHQGRARWCNTKEKPALWIPHLQGHIHGHCAERQADLGWTNPLNSYSHCSHCALHLATLRFLKTLLFVMYQAIIHMLLVNRFYTY